MFRIVVFILLISFVFASPGLLHGASVAAPIIVPSAISSQSRYDIVNPGVITYSTAQAVPVIAQAPVAVAPAVRVASAATSQLDIRRPVVAAAPIIGSVGYGGNLAGGLGLGSVGLGVGGGYGLGVGGGYGYNLGGGYGYGK